MELHARAITVSLIASSGLPRRVDHGLGVCGVAECVLFRRPVFVDRVQTRAGLPFPNSNIGLRSRLTMTSISTMALEPTGPGACKTSCCVVGCALCFPRCLLFARVCCPSLASLFLRDHLNVTTIDPSVFSLFADNATCTQSCSILHSEGSASTEVIQAAAAKHGHIALALHHHALANQFDMENDYVAAIIAQQKIERENLSQEQGSEEVMLL